MYFYNLNQDEWYDILIIPYLQAVKKYHVREDLRANYKFWHVCNLMLSKAVYNHNRAMNRQKRKPIGDILSLDYMVEGDNQFSESTLDSLWIDRKQQTERIVLDRYLLESILEKLTDTQRKIFEMLLEGYSKGEIEKELSITYVVFNSQLENVKKVVLESLVC